MTVAMRRATPDDARPIAEVHVASWRSAYRNIMDPRTLANLSVEARAVRWGERLNHPEPRTVTFVAERDGRIVGFAHTGPTDDEDDDPETTATLFALYLLEEVWGRGIGEPLMEAALDALREKAFSDATLWVAAANEGARRFYERTGWRDDARAKECFGSIDVRADVPTIRYRRDL